MKFISVHFNNLNKCFSISGFHETNSSGETVCDGGSASVCVSRVAQKDVRVAQPEIGEENELEKLTPNWVVGDEQEFLRHGLKNKHKKWILVEKKNKTRWKNYGMKQRGVFRKLQL